MPSVLPMADAVAFLLGWGAGWWLLWRLPVPPPAPKAGRPAVSVVIPARDEEASLPRLLGSLRPQLRAGDEVIVVDDHSGDATASVARAEGATVVAAPELPSGWVGKCWACHTGATRTVNPVIAFLDADTSVEPGGLDRLLADHSRSGGLYSVQPWHDVHRPHERLAALFNLVALMGTGAFTPLRPRRAVGGFGPCMVTTAADYRASGGHAGVRTTVLDDLALAARYRAAGLPVALRAGRGTIRFRMYPDGIEQVVEGFSKNFAAAAASVRPVSVVLISAWMAALSAPFALAVGDPALAAACYLAVAGQLVVHLRRTGGFGWITASVYLVPLAFFLAVFARSLWLTFARRRVRWKGREVPSARRGA